MKRIPTVWAVGAALAVGCGSLLSGNGLGIDVSINAGPVLSQVNTRLLRIAAWVNQRPGEGVRPAEVIHVQGSNDPTELCREVQDPNAIDNRVTWVCKTDIFVAPQSEVWVGAFYEHPEARNQMPSAGEFLTFAGPFTIAAGQSKLEGLDLTILNPDDPDLPSVDEAVATLAAALTAADAEAVFDLVHPFVGGPWDLDFNELQALGRGTFATAATVYADPLSAPFAGMVSAAVRDAVGLEELTIVAELFDETARTARWTLAYSAKLDDNEGRFAVAEHWRLVFAATADAVLLRSWAVDRVDVGDTTITNASLAAGALRVEWEHPAAGLAAGFRLRIDRYDSATSVWTEALVSPDISVNPGGAYVCDIGPGGGCVSGITLPEDEYLRVRIHPLDGNGVQRRPAVAYVAGRLYPF